MCQNPEFVPQVVIGSYRADGIFWSVLAINIPSGVGLIVWSQILLKDKTFRFCQESLSFAYL